MSLIKIVMRVSLLAAFLMGVVSPAWAGTVNTPGPLGPVKSIRPQPPWWVTGKPWPGKYHVDPSSPALQRKAKPLPPRPIPWIDHRKYGPPVG